MDKITPALIKSSIISQICGIIKTLQNGDRVELIPCKDGVKALKVERHEIK